VRSLTDGHQQDVQDLGRTIAALHARWGAHHATASVGLQFFLECKTGSLNFVRTVLQFKISSVVIKAFSLCCGLPLSSFSFGRSYVMSAREYWSLDPSFRSVLEHNLSI